MLPVLVAIAAVVVCAFVLGRGLRRRRISRLRGLSLAPHGESQAAAHRATSARADSDRDVRAHGGLGEDFAIGLTIPAAALWELAKIDGEVIAGISSASAVVDGTHVVSDNFAGFLSYVSQHGDNLVAQGNVSRLVGYVGEQRVAGLLEAQGDTIEMALTANNPRWDLLINDAAANVKTYQDATHALKLAEQDAGTQFILPEDSTHQVPMENVTYLDGFSVTDVRDSFFDSVDGARNLLDGGYVDDAAFGGIPVVLLAVTMYKQSILVREGKRVEDAFRDGAIDVGARAIGALGGMKAGALAGGVVDLSSGGATIGLGAAGGAILGGIGGSRLGAWAVREYRLRPVQEAENELIEALEQFGFAIDDAGGQDLLFAALSAPVDRAGDTLEKLNTEVDRDRRSLRWWLYPGADQVLRAASLEVAVADYGRMADEFVVQAQAWNEIIAGPAGAASLGLAFANVPDLAAATELDESYVARIAKTKRHVTARRVEFQNH